MKESCAKIPDYNAIKAVDLNFSTTNEEMIFLFQFSSSTTQKGALMQIEKPIEEEEINIASHKQFSQLIHYFFYSRLKLLRDDDSFLR